MTLPSPPPMAKGTLSRQLVVRTTALVAAATILLSLVTALASFQILQSQLDGRLESALNSTGRRCPGSRPGDPEGSGLIRIEQAQPGGGLFSSPVTKAVLGGIAAILMKQMLNPGRKA